MSFPNSYTIGRHKYSPHRLLSSLHPEIYRQITSVGSHPPSGFKLAQIIVQSGGRSGVRPQRWHRDASDINVGLGFATERGNRNPNGVKTGVQNGLNYCCIISKKDYYCKLPSEAGVNYMLYWGINLSKLRI